MCQKAMLYLFIFKTMFLFTVWREPTKLNIVQCKFLDSFREVSSWCIKVLIEICRKKVSVFNELI